MQRRRLRMRLGREACRLISLAQIRFDLDTLLDGIHFPINLASGWAQLQLSVFSTFSHFEGLDFATLSFPIPSLSRGGASSFHSYLYTYTYTIVHSPLYPFGSPILFRPDVQQHSLPRPAFRSARDSHSATVTETTSAESVSLKLNPLPGDPIPIRAPSQATAGSSRAT